MVFKRLLRKEATIFFRKSISSCLFFNVAAIQHENIRQKRDTIDLHTHTNSLFKSLFERKHDTKHVEKTFRTS